jgi:hypothetical protein
MVKVERVPYGEEVLEQLAELRSRIEDSDDPEVLRSVALAALAHIEELIRLLPPDARPPDPGMFV